MADRPRLPVRSVRVRITLAATVVTGVAVLLAGSWLVRTVEGSLTDRLRDDTTERIAEVRAALESGRLPSDLDLGAEGGGAAVQVIRGGEVIDASPVLAGLPPLDATSVSGSVTSSAGRRYGTVATANGGVAISSELVDGPFGQVRVLAASPLDSVRRGVDAVKEGLSVAFPLLVGGVALMAWLLAGRALRPVEVIRAEVEAISGSTLDRRVPVPGSGDEVSRLARTMNAMLDRLEDASLRQQRFVADASHELRSPVAAIRTELEVAQRTAAPGDWPAVADRLLTEEARLEAVIADLLLLATLEEGAPQPDAVAVDLAEVAVEEARVHEASGGLPVEVLAPAPVIVAGNRVQLRRALANALDNAVRHARTGVQVSVHTRDGRARVLVDDDGPGIPEADRERVFERFTRLDDSRTRLDDSRTRRATGAGAPAPASGGAGLGLSLVRRIVTAHRGRAHVDTAPLGGARLVLDLPLR